MDGLMHGAQQLFVFRTPRGLVHCADPIANIPDPVEVFVGGLSA